MKVVVPITVLLTANWVLLPHVIAEEQALFVRDAAIRNGKRVPRQTSADQMVQNIIQWLQGVYAKNSRKIRQGTFREYLPPLNTQRPRPFQPPSPPPHSIGDHHDGDFNFIGYPPSGEANPQPPFDFPFKPDQPNLPGFPSQAPDFHTTPSHPSPPSDFHTTPQRPDIPTLPPHPPPGYPHGPPATYIPPGPAYPGGGTPEKPLTYPTIPPSTVHTPPAQTTHPPPTTQPPQTFPTHPPTTHPPETVPTHPPTTHPPQTFPTHPPLTFPTHPPTTHPPQTFPTLPPTTLPTHPPPTTHPPPQTFPTHPPITFPTHPPTQPPTHPPEIPVHTQPPQPFHPATEAVETDATHPAPTKQPEIFTSPEIQYTRPPSPPRPFTNQPDSSNTVVVPTGEDNVATGTQPDEDALKHPPHIHAIDVQCAKDMMTINIEFNRPFNGIIYSKGYYHQPECRYVHEHSNRVKFTFTVGLNTCGTEFVNGFHTQGQSYLENVLVLQNEPGIQEVWDTIRAVRCLWEGNLNKTLNVALSVGMLNQEIVSFSGDTAMAKLDIKIGRGPFAPNAHGLVKIGEIMTLVVSVTGDPGFDVQVKDCRASDASGNNVVHLTDAQGCVLKPKLLGAFQKTRQTGDTGASILAYAYFNAFKFPDVMDLMIECNVELCKTDCDACPSHQKLEPGRRRKRHVDESIGEPVTVGKMLRVVLPQDISDLEKLASGDAGREICLSASSFAASSILLISLLAGSCFLSATLWLRNRRLSQKF